MKKEKDAMIRTKYCNMLIRNNLVKPYDVIIHSYSTYAMKHNQVKVINKHDNRVAPCLPTHSDVLGVVVYDN